MADETGGGLAREVGESEREPTLNQEAGLTFLYLGALFFGVSLIPDHLGRGFAAFAQSMSILFGVGLVAAVAAYLLTPTCCRLPPLATPKATEDEKKARAFRDFVKAARSAIALILGARAPISTDEHRVSGPVSRPTSVRECFAFRLLFKAILVSAIAALALLEVEADAQATTAIVVHTIAHAGLAVIAANVFLLFFVEVSLLGAAWWSGRVARATSGSNHRLFSSIAAFLVQLVRVSGHLMCGLAWFYAATWYRVPFYWQMVIWGVGCLLIPELIEIVLYRPRYLILQSLVGEEPPVSYSELRWRRRPGFYLSTLLAAVVILVAHRSHLEGIYLVLLLAFIVTALRLGGWVLLSTLSSDEARDARIQWIQNLDGHGPIPLGVTTVAYLALVAVLFVRPGLAILHSTEVSHADAQLRAQLELQPDRRSHPPIQPDFEIFVISDTQLRALHGKPSTAHVQLIEDVVTSSLRPIVLDLLSGLTLRHFADVAGQNTWVHLGDLAEISCRSEIERFVKIRERFGSERFAGFARGNHDGFFIGNFAWAPDWEAACPDGPAEADFFPDYLLADGAEQSSDHSFAASVKTLRRGGLSLHLAFLDTSDYGASFVGAAGVAGEISDEQCAWIDGALDARVAPGDPVLIMEHHPSTMLLEGADCITRLASTYNVLAVVSAHTHLAALRHRAGRRCKLRVDRDGRHYCVPEIVVGSTTDSPQEAVWLQIEVSRGAPRLRFTTVQPISRDADPLSRSVARWSNVETQPSSEKGEPVTSLECMGAINRFRLLDACAALLDDQNWFPYNMNPDKVAGAQAETARALFACLDADLGADSIPACRQLARPDQNPLKSDRLEPCLDALYANDQARRAGLCLSWGAAAFANDSLTYRAALDAAFQPHQPGAVLAAPYSPISCTIHPDGSRLPVCTADRSRRRWRRASR